MWPRFASVMIGIWLMFSPWAMGYGDPAAGSDRTVGPLLVAFGLMAAWDVLRPLRWFNLVLGVYLVTVPWIFDFAGQAALNDLFCGIVVMVAALIRGRISHDFDGGWRFVFTRRKSEADG